MSRRLLLAAMCISALSAFSFLHAEESPFAKNSFLGFINGDGSSIDEAVIIKNISDYRDCRDEECRSEEFSKNIEQEYDYCTQTYGIMYRDWEVAGKSELEVDIEQNDKYYDELSITLLPSRQIKHLYFDITDCVLALKDNKLW